MFRSCSLLGLAICQQQLILDYATTQRLVAIAVLHMLTIITHIIVISNHISIRNLCGKAAIV